MIDTCQANTMFSKFYSPNILATGSSEMGENSYSVSVMCFGLSQKLTYALSTRTTLISESQSSTSSRTTCCNSWRGSTRQARRLCKIWYALPAIETTV